MVRLKAQPCKNKALPAALEGLSESSGSESSESESSECESSEGENTQEQREELEQREASSGQQTKARRCAAVPHMRISNGRVYDSVLGTTCHWCRQKTVKVDQVTCTAPGCKVGMRGKDKLPITFCGPCLRNRNGEDAIQAAASGAWVCPVCRGSCGPGCSSCCNCGPCRKKCGLTPTGQLARKVSSSGFTNAHDWLIHKVTGESAEAIAARKGQHAWGLWTRPISQERGVPLTGGGGRQERNRKETTCRGGTDGSSSETTDTGDSTAGDASMDGSDGGAVEGHMDGSHGVGVEETTDRCNGGGMEKNAYGSDGVGVEENTDGSRGVLVGENADGSDGVGVEEAADGSDGLGVEENADGSAGGAVDGSSGSVSREVGFMGANRHHHKGSLSTSGGEDGEQATGSVGEGKGVRCSGMVGRGRTARGGHACRGDDAHRGGAGAGRAAAFRNAPSRFPTSPSLSPSPSTSLPAFQHTRQPPSCLPSPPMAGSQQQDSATKHLPPSSASQQAPAAAPLPPASPPRPRPLLAANNPACMSHQPSTSPGRAASPPPPTVLLPPCASHDEPPSARACPYASPGAGSQPSARACSSVPAKAHLQLPTAPPLQQPPSSPPSAHQPPSAQAQAVSPLLPKLPEASRPMKQAWEPERLEVPRPTKHMGEPSAVDDPFTTPLVTCPDSKAPPSSPVHPHNKHTSRTSQAHASPSGPGTEFSPVRKCSLASQGTQSAGIGARGDAGIGRRADGGEGGDVSKASNRGALGEGGGKRSTGVGSGQEEPCAKRRRRMGSLEEAAHNASARLHAALQDLSTSKSQLQARWEAHRQEVDAHLAERARLISQDEALMEEENKLRRALPHLHSLYGEFAAIMAQDSH